MHKSTEKKSGIRVFSLSGYIKLRLGQTDREQVANFLARPFTAFTFTRFWWYWNPVYGYYLYYFCYRPLAIFLPRSLAVLLTFIFCGALHDLPFILPAVITGNRMPSFTITVMFFLLGTVVIVTEKLGINFRKIPVKYRWFIHLGNLLLCWELSLYLTK